MRYFSLFSGIGGFELGIQQAYELSKMGAEPEDCTDSQSESSQHGQRPLCIGYSEIDKYAIQLYQQHFPDHKNYGDITTINTKDLPDFDLLVGGFPCQSFSIAGKRRGFEDTRGTLFFEIARIIKEKKPRLLLLENVKGLLSHDSGQTFYTIVSTLNELGYDLQWQVLNSKNFGVPQNRERVFIIGHLGGTRRPEVFPFIGGDSQDNEPRQVSSTINAGGGGQGAKTGLYAIPVLTPNRIEKRQNGRRFKENGDPSFTLTSQDKHGIYDGATIRRLSPVECERLQGFPDGYTEGISDTQRYKCLGNAVTVNVVREIMKKIIYA